jgi:hypothetical protein
VSDPGFSRTIQSAMHANAYTIPSEWAFKPPEELGLVMPNDLRPSKPKDVYSVACVIFEVSVVLILPPEGC